MPIPKMRNMKSGSQSSKNNVRYSKPLESHLRCYQNSDSQHAAKASDPIVRRGAVVIDKDVVIAAIAKESPAEVSYFSRSFHPA